MWVVASAGVVVLLFAQTVTTRACDRTQMPPATTSPTPAAAEVFTTQDGVRFVVETPVMALVVPWSMAFAPDGRIFLTERAGRVRVLNLAAGTSELALTLEDVYIRHATDIKFNNLKLSCTKKDYRTAIVLDDVHRTEFTTTTIKEMDKKKTLHQHKSSDIIFK